VFDAVGLRPGPNAAAKNWGAAPRAGRYRRGVVQQQRAGAASLPGRRLWRRRAPGSALSKGRGLLLPGAGGAPRLGSPVRRRAPGARAQPQGAAPAGRRGHVPGQQVRPSPRLAASCHRPRGGGSVALSAAAAVAAVVTERAAGACRQQRAPAPGAPRDRLPLLELARRARGSRRELRDALALPPAANALALV
jgi:hypothetical protein